jgi:hypothetical protein
MLVSDLITELQIMQRAYGDVPVVRYDERLQKFIDPWVRSVLIAHPQDELVVGHSGAREPLAMTRCVSVTGWR